MKGAAWSAPAVIAAAIVPAYASSKKGTATGQTTMTYADAVGTKTMTKNTGPTSI